ncbi:hypothetical protein GE061_010221 [Apolygus lucorum]|uniref:Uncharacterized protein n=1 Tax=Apolygus lucorum TaxID=248454 RepID=A0A6A4KJN2_APOLU|nr:hypothetical protein GE061_010221 [Apolygus lucorum]
MDTTMWKPENMTITASPGETVMLHCDIKGQDPEQSLVHWYKYHEGIGKIRLFEGIMRLIKEHRYNMNPRNYTLTIEDVRAIDSGLFTCEFLEHNTSSKLIHRLNVTPTVEESSTFLIVAAVCLIILLVLAILLAVFYFRKRKTQYAPTNSTEMAFPKK